MQIIHRCPEAPPDVAAVPADAIRTPSGLAYKVLRPAPARFVEARRQGAGELQRLDERRQAVDFVELPLRRRELPADGGIKAGSEAVQ